MPFKPIRRRKSNRYDIPLDDKSAIRGLVSDDYTARHVSTVAPQGAISTTSSLESELMMEEFEHVPYAIPSIEEYREVVEEGDGVREGAFSLENGLSSSPPQKEGPAAQHREERLPTNNKDDSFWCLLDGCCFMGF